MSDEQFCHEPCGCNGEQFCMEPKSIAGGFKFDQGKARMDLIPPEAEEEEAYVWAMGADKYGAHNFREGIVYSRIIAALLRHASAIKRGEDIDPESGRLHAAHIRCCAGMLICFQDRKDLDDRYKKSGQE